MLYVLIGILLLAGVIFFLKKAGILNPAGAAGEMLPYRRKECLLTNAERSFYEVLVRAVGNQWLVFPKIRVSDLLSVKSTPNRQSYRNKIQSKHADFVLCRKDTVGPVLVIELNDSSHDAPERRERDAFVGRAYRAAGLPFLSIRVQKGYPPAELASQIALAISGNANGNEKAVASGLSRDSRTN